MPNRLDCERRLYVNIRSVRSHFLRFQHVCFLSLQRPYIHIYLILRANIFGNFQQCEKTYYLHVVRHCCYHCRDDNVFTGHNKKQKKKEKKNRRPVIDVDKALMSKKKKSIESPYVRSQKERIASATSFVISL